jgi:predicted ATPase/class 3 adenylate cyclase
MDAPEGTLSMLFSDIEGSTKLLEHLGDGYADALIAHHRIVRSALALHDGSERHTEGDAFFIVFRRARDALLAGADIQRRLVEHLWPGGAPVRVRIGIHTGEPRLFEGGDYVGLDVHRAARICAAAHGGQMLCSEATIAVVVGTPEGLVVEDLGEHRLKDLSRPMRLFQVTPVGLPREFPPPRTLDAERTNLPALANALIGREDEVGEVRDRLATRDVRLITLTGPGGAGKTRTALSAAAEASDLFPGGTYVAFLAGVREVDGVLPAIAAALAIQDTPGRTLLESITEALRGPPFLLVLDNLEHLPAAAPLVAELLARVPALKVLATSRAPLHVAAERELEVPPLPERDGVALFLERARAVRAEFSATEEAASRICRRLDGLPLAIELAAARTRLLSAEALLERLDHRLELLIGGARDMPDRQRTLRATIVWSHDLLGAEEQRVFRRLAVFAGGFCLDLLTPVVQADETVLEALVEHSLVRRIAPAGREPRFLMLETIREFALERLDEHGEAGELHDHHAETMVAFLERAAEEIAGRHQQQWLDRIDAELDNVRTAVAWIRERQRHDLELRVAAAIRLYGLLRGRWTETRGWVEGALAHGPEPAPDHFGGALAAAVILVRWDGDDTAADARARELLAFADEHGDRWARAQALMGLAITQAEAGAFEPAMALLTEAVDLSREVGDNWALGVALNNLGDTALKAGDLETAGARFAESLAHGERLGLVDRVATARGNVASVLLAAGDPASARAELRRCLKDARALGYPDPVLYGTATLAAITLGEGDAEEAARLTGTVEAAFEAANTELQSYERHRHEALVATLRDRLGAERLEQLRADGRTVALDDALDAVL